jgi:hypothetical protein
VRAKTTQCVEPPAMDQELRQYVIVAGRHRLAVGGIQSSWQRFLGRLTHFGTRKNWGDVRGGAARPSDMLRWFVSGMWVMNVM